jgi:hypothetical protein
MMATITLTQADKDADRHAWAMLQRARPAVDWNKSTLRRADMTGEGQWSRVMAGHDDERQLYVGIVRPGREGATNPHVVTLGSVQSLSLAFHKLEKPEQCLALDETPLEGCRPKRGKSGLTLTIDSVTVTRLYWNGPAKRFDSTPGPRPPSE